MQHYRATKVLWKVTILFVSLVILLFESRLFQIPLFALYTHASSESDKKDEPSISPFFQSVNSIAIQLS